MSTTPELTIRDARPDEFFALGRLLVDVYSRLEGFPTPAAQPGYLSSAAASGRGKNIAAPAAGRNRNPA